MKYGNLEFRHLQGRPAEIVQWATNSEGKEYCFSLLFYEPDAEGYEIRFVGDRPLQYEDKEIMFAMMKFGQVVMDEKWKIERLQR